MEQTMATSKHFPVQKYSPHNDMDDYGYTDTPYNSVSSFKSYQSDQKRNSSVASTAPYGYANDGLSCTPYNEKNKSYVEANSRGQVPYIDNTVVSAYKGAKPPIPTQKLNSSTRSNSKQHSGSANNKKPANGQDTEHKKFGIEHLQSISKQLQDENKEFRRHRDSKGHKELPALVAESSLGDEKGVQGEHVGEPDQILQRETGTPSPDSRTWLENGRHSSMSRRRLPKVPVDQSQSKYLPDVTDIKKVPNSTHAGGEDVSKTNQGAYVNKDNSESVSERRNSLQWDSEIVPKTVNIINRLSGSEVVRSSESPKDRIARKLGKQRSRDKKRSQSVGDQTKSAAQEALNMMAGLKEKENVKDMVDSAENRNRNMIAAKNGCAASAASSPNSDSISRYSGDFNTKRNIYDSKIGDNEYAVVDHQGCQSARSEKSGRVEDWDILSADKIKRSHTHRECPKHSEGMASGSNAIDPSQDDYSIVAALNDIVDNATARLTVELPEGVFFSFDHSVIQELTDSVMGNGEHPSKAQSENKELYEKGRNVNEGLDRTTSNDDKQFIEGKSFCGKSPNENEKNQSSMHSLNNNKIYSYQSVENNVSDKENKSDEVNKEKVGTRVLPQKAKVERSPSYRKKVMARAKSRYKKSSMLKECSCTRNENGEIVTCQFCANYEKRKRRSKSSLGLENVGKDMSEFTEVETSDISSYSEISSPRRAFTPGLPPLPSSKSPRPLRKLQVSSRVDVLMSSDLFRKHLQKHETLLQKHTMFRRTGMRKSVSNLDLSEGYMMDSDSQCETESVMSEINNENDANINEDILSQSHDFTPDSRESRRHSLGGDSDTPVENTHKNKKKHFRTLPSSIGRSRLPIPSFTQPTSRPNIPSFHEFKVLKELSKSTEALNFEESSSENPSLDANSENNDNSMNMIDGFIQEDEMVENKTEISDLKRKMDLVPIQLQVIKESRSKENLVLNSALTEDTVTMEKPEPCENLNCKAKENSQTENLPSTHSEQTESKSDQIAIEGKDNIKVADELNRVNEIEKHTDSIDGHEHLTRQQSEPTLKLRQQRVRPKLKSRTLSRLDQEPECLSDTASGTVNNSMLIRGRRKPGAKRPRSLISKKSSLASLIRDSDGCSQNSEDENSNSEKSINLRPKLKVGHNVNRSKSDSKYEMDKAKSMQDKEDISKSRNLLIADKGRNTVSFDLEDTSQCSPFDIGESETSTSVAESLSDSIRSEANFEENIQLPNDLDDTGKLLLDPDNTGADNSALDKQFKEELVSQVLRSTSDVCEITQEAVRKRRERKDRPYKSDPFSGTEIIPASKRCVLREEKAKLRQHMDFANSSKEEILTFLDGVSHGDITACDSFPSLEELIEDDEQLHVLSEGDIKSRKIRKHHSNVSSLSTDSGVIGQDGSHDSQQSSPSNTLSHSQSERNMSPLQDQDKKRLWSASCSDLSKHEAQDCVNCGPQDLRDVNRLQVCAQCLSRRRERKEIILEILDTEMNYGRDLNILKEEFYKPIMKAGLLSKDQLDAIFLNLDELIHVNKHFITKLKLAVHTANQNNDNEFEEVMIGSLFLESSTMFLTFENYCVNQAQAPVLLEQLEREKELLRIFLQVSQNDNHQLRRMHLKSFLMVPVQRIMKYPLLLDRLYKTTSAKHMDKSYLKEAKDKIEDILGHINAKSRTTSFRQRKPSQKSAQHCSVTEKIEVSRVALETLQWNRKDVCDVITSQLYITQPVDHLWAIKKCKNYKFTTVYGVLMTLMQQQNETGNDNDINVKRNSSHHSNNENNNNNVRVKSAAVVFIKEKNGRFQVMREPFMLEKCVVSQDPEYPEVFEILEWSKEAFLIKTDNPQDTKLWVQNLRQQMNNLGFWRKRRNALPNILLNHLS